MYFAHRAGATSWYMAAVTSARWLRKAIQDALDHIETCQPKVVSPKSVREMPPKSQANAAIE